MKFYVLFIIFFGFFCELLSLEIKSIDEQWETYKQKYKKSYNDTEEEVVRKKNFIDSVEKVTRHNELFKEGKVKYEMRIPRSADLSREEFVSLRTGYLPYGFKGNTMRWPSRDDTELPENFDWKDKGIVTPIKQQGYCGSCWAFSMCASIESQLIRKGIAGPDIDLSEQQLVDCARNTSAFGCDGGDPLFVFIDLKNARAGVAGESSYRYRGVQRNCKRYLRTEKYFIKDVMYYRRPVCNEDYMKEALATLGPLSGGFAVTEDFLHYKSGVFSNDKLCTKDYEVNHAITITGYGVDAKGTKFWTIKNSWGTDWGENGFGRIERGKELCKIGCDYVVPIIGV